LLPKNLPHPPSYHKVNPADVTMLSLALTSDTLPLTELQRYAEDFIAPQLSQMTGVGLVDFHGEQRPAVRLQLDPDKLAGLGLTMEDVRGIIGTQTVNAPKGTLDGEHKAIVLKATDQITSADEYRSLIVAYRNGAPIRLADLGSVADGAEDDHEAAWVQGQRAIIIDIHKQPGFNVVETIARIRERVPAFTASLPAAVQLRVVGDRTQTIQASLGEVKLTLGITIVLVVLVIFLFLRNVRATLVPAATIPLSLVATFGVMYLLGYSLDNISLMALIIAVGFVVDDAIVVVENVARHLEQGATPLQAAVRGSREVCFTIISMTLSLIAVFIPILLMSGIIGRLFREFAVTLSVAVLMSGLVSLTVTPMMCAWLIRHEDSATHGRLFRWSERVFDRITAAYATALDAVLRRRVVTLAVTLATLALAGCLYVVVPKGFVPQSDTGLIIGVAQAAPDISFAAMSERIQALGRIVQADPDVDNVYFWIGANPTVSQGRMMINLKPHDQRKAKAPEVMARLKKKVAGVEGITLGMQVRQDIQMGGRPGAAQYQYTLQGTDVDELEHWAGEILRLFRSLPELRDVSSDQQGSATSATLNIDRDTASRLGISVQAIDDELYDAFGQRQIATLFTQSNQYKVVEEADRRFQLSSEALGHFYVRSPASGKLVPLALLASVETGVSPIAIAHQDLLPAITLSFNLARGRSLGDAVDAIHVAEAKIGKPDRIVGSFQGTARAFEGSLKSQPWLILAALVTVYIVLGVLYESAIHPLTIISTLPSAGVGALLALLAFRIDLSVMGMIGILLLIGIVKKNAIMMIDFALVAQREQGLPPQEAIRQGALLRFRPIMMTTLAALLGALPLALGTGAGASLRTPLGISLVGGLLVSQVLTLFTTPVVYLWFERLRTRRVSASPELREAAAQG
jgi:multidrug efflux pump